MWTPTFGAQGEQDYDKAYRIMSGFLHRRAAALGGGRGYLAIPELHPNGHGWHFHVLLSVGMPVQGLRELQVAWSEHLRLSLIHI